jgi:hypothetical protein
MEDDDMNEDDEEEGEDYNDSGDAKNDRAGKFSETLSH